jgi:CRISPR/Cas system-associated exonuclease Cas4 (RecB family)
LIAGCLSLQRRLSWPTRNPPSLGLKLQTPCIREPILSHLSYWRNFRRTCYTIRTLYHTILGTCHVHRERSYHLQIGKSLHDIVTHAQVHSTHKDQHCMLRN